MNDSMDDYYRWGTGDREGCRWDERLCSSVEADVVQMVSYINYELHIGWPWQREAVTSSVTSQ